MLRASLRSQRSRPRGTARPETLHGITFVSSSFPVQDRSGRAFTDEDEFCSNWRRAKLFAFHPHPFLKRSVFLVPRPPSQA